MMESCSVTQAKHIADMFPHASEDALDLLVKLLQVSYELRVEANVPPCMTAHAWFVTAGPHNAHCRKLGHTER
jgi:hypothetical protein